LDAFKIVDGFYITIKDNFLEKEKLLELQKNLPLINYSGKYNVITNINHIWFSAPASKEITNIIKAKCEKLLNKKFKINFCSYTLLSTVEPLPHCDLNDETDYQVIVYIKGDVDLHKGTGFYVKGELNTHIGFNENRAVIWHSNSWHTPMNWAADNKSKRYSVICQLKELK
tara:strand:- start:2450 stop:2962 length:513 start_codon:yes stop_codon:yes gene_type:complete